ncbi:MAG: hypothetical protein ACHQ0J_11890 [Candidatus Dormibacterales bacterium]
MRGDVTARHTGRVARAPHGADIARTGGLGGLVLGLGIALMAVEAGVLNPDNYGGLVVIGVFTVLGAMAPIIKGRMG